jgi:hypothetical protein
MGRFSLAMGYFTSSKYHKSQLDNSRSPSGLHDYSGYTKAEGYGGPKAQESLMSPASDINPNTVSLFLWRLVRLSLKQ